MSSVASAYCSPQYGLEYGYSNRHPAGRPRKVTSSPPPRPAGRIASVGHQPRRKFVSVDGPNVMWVEDSPRLEWVLTLVAEIARSGIDCLVAFDANTRYLLKKAQGSLHVDAYLYLLRTYKRFFVEVTGGTRADDLILAEADARSGAVVSNDHFEPYVGQYPWVKKADRIYRFNAFRDHLLVAGLRLPVLGDLRAGIAEVERALA
jgi:hypothetical protein